MRIAKTLLLPLVLSAMVSSMVLSCSDEDDACDEYINYICDCHPDDDCDSLRNTYDDADPDLQDQCAIELEELQQTDEEDDHVCGDTGS